MARWQVYRSVDLVVHVHGGNDTGRWVTEIIAPSVEEDGARFIVHRLFGARPDAPDDRARVLSEPQRPMLDRLLAADPTFTAEAWHRRADTHRPLAARCAARNEAWWSEMFSFVAMVPVAGVALAVAILIGGAFACVAASTMPARGRASGPSSTAATTTPSMLHGLGGQRIAVALAVGFVVLLLTRWPLLAVAAALLTAVWGRLLHDERADDERRRIEGIAKWLEDLRDTLRGSSVGAEEALEQVAARPPAAIRDPLATYVFRRRQGFRTEDALIDLADGLAHPTSDAAIAAIRLVVSGTAGAGRLYRTVTALAAAARATRCAPANGSTAPAPCTRRR